MGLYCSEKSYQALIFPDCGGTLYFGNEEMSVSAGETVFIPAGLGAYSVNSNGTLLIASNPPKYFAEIDLNGKNIEVDVVDEYGVIYAKAERKTSMPCSYNELLNEITLCTREAAEESGISFEDIN